MDRSRQSPAEFLAQVLNRRGGPDDLPYSSEAVWTIRQHLLDTVQVLHCHFELHQHQRLGDEHRALNKAVNLAKVTLNAEQDFPTLTLKVQKYTHTDGRTVPLLMADGTLPMYYQVCSCFRKAPSVLSASLASLLFT